MSWGIWFFLKPVISSAVITTKQSQHTRQRKRLCVATSRH